MSEYKAVRQFFEEDGLEGEPILFRMGSDWGGTMTIFLHVDNKKKFKIEDFRKRDMTEFEEAISSLLAMLKWLK